MKITIIFAALLLAACGSSEDKGAIVLNLIPAATLEDLDKLAIIELEIVPTLFITDKATVRQDSMRIFIKHFELSKSENLWHLSYHHKSDDVHSPQYVANRIGDDIQTAIWYHKNTLAHNAQWNTSTDSLSCEESRGCGSGADELNDASKGE